MTTSYLTGRELSRRLARSPRDIGRACQWGVIAPDAYAGKVRLFLESRVAELGAKLKTSAR